MWGRNNFGQLGDGTTIGGYNTPQLLASPSPGLTITTLSLGGLHSGLLTGRCTYMR